MALNYQFGTDIQAAIRNLCLGRVLLKSNIAAGVTSVPVRTVLDIPSEILPGWQLFYHNTTSAILVEPTSADKPDKIAHQESVTIHANTWTAGVADGDIKLSAATTKAYTTAAGAYIRMATLPAVSSGLEFIQNDFIPTLRLDPPDDWFPGVLVVNMGQGGSSFTNQQIGFDSTFRIYYCDFLRDDIDNTTVLWQKGEQLRDLILEDNFLGGTALESDYVRMIPWHRGELRRAGVQFRTPSGYEVGWVEIDFDVNRPGYWNKAPAS